MGLDVYFHRVKKARKSKDEPLKTIKEYNDILNHRAKDKAKRYAKRMIKKLGNAANDSEYAEIYHEIFPKGMKKLTQYDWRYQKFVDEVKPLDEVKKFFENFTQIYYAEEDAYFRKVNFIYHYFQPKLVDECAFVTKTDLEDIIERCDKILEGLKFKGEEIPYEKIDLAQELLPTQSGFFFGSTDYDRWYFSDVKDARRQMKKLLRGFNEDTDVIYVVMSW